MPHVGSTGFPTPEDARGPLAVVRGLVVESSANTLTELEIALPVNPSLNIGALVRKIVFEPSKPLPIIPAADAVSGQETRFSLSTRQGRSTFPAFQDPGTLAAGVITTQAASQLADSGVSIRMIQQGEDWNFGGFGLLVVSRVISLYVESSGVASPGNVRVFVGFHLVEVSPNDLLAAISTVSDVS